MDQRTEGWATPITKSTKSRPYTLPLTSRRRVGRSGIALTFCYGYIPTDRPTPQILESRARDKKEEDWEVYVPSFLRRPQLYCKPGILFCRGFATLQEVRPSVCDFSCVEVATFAPANLSAMIL